MNYPRIMLAAGSSGSGKTLITCGLLQALKNRQLNIRSFKCGPDYIDPMFHTKVLGVPCINLDTFFTGEDVTRYLFVRNANEADISVLEGVMGFYDGVAGISTLGSSYDLARVTDTPVIMIINAAKLSPVSLAVTLKGMLEYRKDNRICGVILNRLNPMLYKDAKAVLEEYEGIRVLGYVPEVDELHLDSRHLGLVMPDEVDDLNNRLNTLAKQLEKTIDIDAIIEIADGASDIDIQASFRKLVNDGLIIPEDSSRLPKVKIAVARDEAFCFYYEDNMAMLRDLGAELIEFSPIRDESIPEGVSGIIIGGGYPENYCQELSSNKAMIESLNAAHKAGIPIAAECGGFMYMHDTMEDTAGNTYEMAGIIEGNVSFKGKLVRFGYIELEFMEDTLLGAAGTKTKAHEFHYFDSTNNGESAHAKKPLRDRSWECIIAKDNLFAGFPHIYYYANPLLAKTFIEKCREYGR